MDPDFREFLEMDEALPKSTGTSAFSGAGVMRLFNKVGEQVKSFSVKMDEKDQVGKKIISSVQPVINIHSKILRALNSISKILNDSIKSSVIFWIFLKFNRRI